MSGANWRTGRIYYHIFRLTRKDLEMSNSTLTTLVKYAIVLPVLCQNVASSALVTAQVVHQF